MKAVEAPMRRVHSNSERIKAGLRAALAVAVVLAALAVVFAAFGPPSRISSEPGAEAASRAETVADARRPRLPTADGDR